MDSVLAIAAFGFTTWVEVTDGGHFVSCNTLVIGPHQLQAWRRHCKRLRRSVTPCSSVRLSRLED